MTVRNKIKDFLDSRELTVYRFQKDTGIARRTAYDLTNKPDQLPATPVLIKICDTYRIQPCEILEWIEFV